MVELGAKIELVCVLPADEQADPTTAQKVLGVSSCSLIRRPSAKRQLPNLKTPYTFRTFVAPAVQKAVHEELSRLLAADHRRSTFVLFDGLHPFASLSSSDLNELPKKCRGIVYRAHNYETALWEQCIDQTALPWMKWFYAKQANLVRTFECDASRVSNVIAAVSEDDARKFRQFGPNVLSLNVPIGMDLPALDAVAQVAADASTLNLLFVGRLDWIPNRSGLSWFLQNVWSKAVRQRPELRLKVAGVGDGRWLQHFERLPNLQILGRVPLLEPLYTESALTLAPLFQGSGTRVKILESARFARPVLSTALGAEGTGLQTDTSYFQAETELQWLERLQTITLNQCRIVGWNALLEIRNRFDARKVAVQLHQFLDRLNAPVTHKGGTNPERKIVMQESAR
jgi:polysaccharide biosynthesis protein PslH